MYYLLLTIVLVIYYQYQVKKRDHLLAFKKQQLKLSKNRNKALSKKLEKMNSQLMNLDADYLELLNTPKASEN